MSFYFVVNDKYMGVNADCEQAIQAIEQEHGLKKAGFKTAADLEDLLFSLDEDKIYNIVGLPFDPLRIKLDYTVLSEIIEYLMKLSLPETQDGPIIYPDWDQKVTFNKLGELEARYLSNGFLQVGSLDEYLKNQSNTFADKVKDKLREIYMECSEEYSGSVLFWEMVEKISGREDQSFQTTAIILLSKYFESCDVFEEPDDTTNKTY